MKVLFFLGSLRMGGAENVATLLCETFQRNLGWYVALVTGESEETDFYKPECTSRVSLDYDYSTDASLKEQWHRLRKFRTVVKQESPDLVVLFCTPACLRGLLAVIGLECKTIACEHSNYFLLENPIKRLFRNWVYMLASKVFLLTERDVENYPFYLRRKIFVMKNPLGMSGEKISRKFNNKLLAVGRLNHHKGYDLLLRNFSKLDNKFTLTIVGDGKLREELIMLATELGVKDRVFFAGASKDVSRYYREASLLVLTSRREGLPMVICEANAFGLPVVSYDCETGPREMIVDGENGFVVENGDSESFNSLIERISGDASLYAKMSVHAKERAGSYSIDKIVGQWRDSVASLGLDV